MHKLTGKQSKMARSLLKWNVYDLCSHVNGIHPKRVESFERGIVHIIEWENDEMVKAFRKEGILFNADMDVTLIAADKQNNEIKKGASGEGAHITLDADQVIVSDTTTSIIKSTEDKSLSDAASVKKEQE